jgi:hypothetical protein
MKQFKPLVLLLICLTPVFALTAKAGDDNGNNKDNGNHYAYGHDDPKEGSRVPINGGIGLLLVAGAAFGIKKVWDKNKKDVLQA